MRVILFLGPTLELDAVREAWRSAPCTLEIRPPAAQGDVYAAALESPWAIAVVDGYFEQVPSIWHKEILWALAAGIHVFGASSMGALRAAELDPFGMVGVGQVFEAFRDGTLERDDEVAVVHGPEEAGYRLFSDALVDIRFNLDAARRDGVIDDETSAELFETAASTFYPFRTWQGLLQEAHAGGRDTEALQIWASTHYSSYKRNDALRLLAELRRVAELELGDVEAVKTPAESPELEPVVPQTTLWKRFVRETEQRAAADVPDAATVSGVVDEMRLCHPEAYMDLRLRAQLRYRAAPYTGRRTSLEDEASTHMRRYRRERGLTNSEATQRHLDEIGLKADTLADLLRREAELTFSRTPPRPWLDVYLADLLRLDGRFETYADRRRRKEVCLDAQAAAPSEPGDRPMDDETDDLWRWYFEANFERAVPHDLELYARRLDFAGSEALRQAVEHERLFVTKENS